MSAPIRLRLYPGPKCLVAYDAAGRTWRTASREGRTVPLGLNGPWVIVDRFDAVTG